MNVNIHCECEYEYSLQPINRKSVSAGLLGSCSWRASFNVVRCVDEGNTGLA